MELKELSFSDKENSVKFVLMNSGEEVGYGYIFSREINPIEIYINEENQSSGYGKFLFNSLLNILREHGLKGVVFQLNESDYRFINIIRKAGAVEIGRQFSEMKFIIKL